jgi:hypothetical protein
MRKPVELTIPDTLDPVHAALLREHHFETAGRVEFVMRGFAYDGMRVLYAIANPSATALVYVGDSEVARDLKKRLKDHLDSRRMAGLVEPDSLLFVHVMVTEYMVLDRFEEETGRLPTLNRSKAPKNAGGRHYKVNGRDAMEAAEQRRAPTNQAKADASAVPVKAAKKKPARTRNMVELLNASGAPPKKRKATKSKRKPRSVKVTLLC